MMKFKPQLREKTAIELRSIVMNSVAGILENPLDHPYKSCLNCEYFNEPKELCVMFNQRPPAKIIAFGCVKHEDKDQIPF